MQMATKENSRPVTVAHIDSNPRAARFVESLAACMQEFAFEFTFLPAIKALARFQPAQPPELILLDLDLPDAQGAAAIRAVRQRFPQQPLIVITDADNTEWRIAARQLGVSDYLLRGELNLALLRRTLTTALPTRSLHDGAPAGPTSAGPPSLPAAGAGAQARVVLWSQAAADLSGGANMAPGSTELELEPPAQLKRSKREERFRQMARRFFDETQAKTKQYEAHQQMVSSLVHDLRSPLGSLSLLMGIPGDPPNFGRLDPVTWNLTKMQLQLAVELCNQLLDIRRIERGQFKTRPERESLRQTIRTALSVFELLAAEKEIQVKVSAPDDECLLDHSTLRRILMNLLDNALRFSPAGTRLAVAARLYTGKVTIKVTDQGPGIPGSDLDRVFDLYWTKRDGAIPGRGVGLAFCKHAAEAMGGSISVESKPGSGTAFTLRLPLLEAQELLTVMAAAAGG